MGNPVKWNISFLRSVRYSVKEREIDTEEIQESVIMIQMF